MRGSVPPDETTDAPFSRRASSRRPRRHPASPCVYVAGDGDRDGRARRAIVNVALPTIARELATTPAASVWIVNAFQLAVTVSLLPLAALGDSLGYRRVYWPGLAVFTAASLACALAPTLFALTLARAIQGFGAAGIMSVNIALVRFIYPSSRLGQGVGNIALVVAVCSAGGPSVAAAILSVASWRWLFLVNVPIAAAALVMAARTLA